MEQDEQRITPAVLDLVVNLARCHQPGDAEPDCEAMRRGPSGRSERRADSRRAKLQ